MNYEVVKWEEAIGEIGNAYKNKQPFSFISFGDAENIFLAVPEIKSINNLEIYLKISGVTKGMKTLKKKMIDLISKNDFIFVHKLANKKFDVERMKRSEWAKFFYVWPDVLKYYNANNVKVVEGTGKRYSMITDGSFFNMISGARVLLIGFYSTLAEERFKNPEFVEHYKKMGFDKVNIVGSIPCPEFKVGEVVEDILEKTKEFDYDVALLGVGIPSCYLCPKIKQMGKIAIDVGHIIQAMAGHGDKKRPFINMFDL